MITVEPIHKRGMMIAREASWGTNPAAGLYSEGGKWFPFMTTSAPGSLRTMGGNIIPEGQVGQRDAYLYEPTPGGWHGEGSLDIPLASDVAGLLLVAALGSVSTALTNDAANPLLASGSLGSSPATLTITNPTAGAILKFTIAGATGGSGTIAVTGVRADGATVSETIQVSGNNGNGTFYSRFSYTSASAIMTHTLTGSPTRQVDGVVKAVHTITGTDSNPSLAIEEFGDPQAGSGNSWFWNGLVVSQLNINYEATDEGGLVTLAATFLGKARSAATKRTYRTPAHVPFPSWAIGVTKGGVAYSRVQSLSLQIATGNELVRTSNGSRDPQGVVYGARRVTGEFTIAQGDDTEYQAWEDRTPGAYTFSFVPPFKLTTSVNHQLDINLPEIYFSEAPTSGAGGQVAQGTFPFYARATVEQGAMNAVLTNSVISYA